MKLAEMNIEPLPDGTVPLTEQEALELGKGIPDWEIMDDEIEREYTFGDFREAIAFVNRIADIAEAANHHPEIEIKYNRVEVELSTHSIGGLSKNDFILAAKFDTVVEVTE